MLTDIQKININKLTQRVLHVPGNSIQGNVLEMAIVLDCSIEKETAIELSKEILGFMRKQGDPFLNMRINLLKWKTDQQIDKSVTSYPEILMGRIMNDKDYHPEDTEDNAFEKHYDELTGQLKKFYARSKLIILLTQKDRTCIDPVLVNENLNPFLYRKVITVYTDGSTKYPFKLPETVQSEEAIDNSSN